MGEDYYEVSWINFEKAILHGRINSDEYIEKVLTDEEKELLYALNERHRREEYELLKGFASNS